MGDLIEYYGTECVHCKEMEPLIKQLQQELGVTIERKEVWHNSANQAELIKRASGKCAGIPFFYNKKTGAFICGAAPYAKLKAWAQST